MMEIKTTRDLGVWFTSIRECKNDIIMSNPINLKYSEKKWVSVDSLLELSPKELIEEVRQLHIMEMKR